MQILNIPEIKGNFYGGNPYSISFNIGFGDTPSSLVIRCINEKGVYQKPNLSWSNVVSITAGNFKFKGYLVEYKIDKSVSEKTLELSYEDTSSLLRRTFIGLHKRHGINPNAKASYNNNEQINIGYKNLQQKIQNNIIILGREMHPCDINNDGKINNLDAVDVIDFCDPCPNCPPKKYEFRCDGQNDLKIFDVKYTFSELLSVLGVEIPRKISERKNFFRDYWGSLDQVLSNWCTDFGYSYYWDYSASSLAAGIKLIDRTVPISVGFTPTDCQAVEIFEGETIKNSFAQGTISYYAREGQSKQYSCDKTTYENLSCLHLRDLYNKNNYTNFDEKIGWRELAVGLSYYSSSLRDCMFWFNYYQIYNKNEAKRRVVDLKNKSELEQDKVLKELGNMKILKVIDSSDSLNFKKCEELLGDSIEIFKSRSKQLKREDGNPSYYFFVADYNEEIAATQYTTEANLAENYIGRFWVKAGTFDTCNGVSDNSRIPNVDIIGYNGENGNYIKQGEWGSYPNFCNFGHEEKSSIDNFIVSSKQKQAENSRAVDLGGYSAPIKLSKSFILLERQAKWYPNKSSISQYEATINYYQNLIFQKLDVTSNGKPSLLNSIYPDFGKNKNISLFVVQETDGPLSLTISEIDNFLEPSDLQKIYANSNDVNVCTKNPTLTNKDNSYLIGTVGLKNTKCAWINFDGFSFMMPAQSTEIQGLDYQNGSAFDNENNIAGYKVKVDTSFGVNVCIPKIETSLVSVPDGSNCGRFDVNFVNISNEDINIFSSQSCTPSAEQLQKIHEQKGILTNISNTRSEKLLQYKIIGLPNSIPSISQGLDSLTIDISDNGVFTTFSLSDKIRKVISEDLFNSDYINKRYNTIENYLTPKPYNIAEGL